jgi:hypothetical protein
MNSPRFRAPGFAAVAAVVIAVAMGAPLIQPQPQSARVQLVLGTPSPPITLREYLQRQRETSRGLIANTNLSNYSGRVVTYAVAPPPDMENAPCELRWTEFERHRGRPAEEGNWRYEAVLGWPDGLLVQPGAGEEQVSGEIWVPLPNQLVDVGQFFIRLRLICGGSTVTEANTVPFRVNVGQAAARPPSP